MHQYVANRYVFRECPKLFLPITGFCKLSGIPDRQTSHTESPTESTSAIKADSVARYDQELSGGRSEMLPQCTICDWLAQFHEVRRRLTVQAVECTSVAVYMRRIKVHEHINPALCCTAREPVSQCISIKLVHTYAFTSTMQHHAMQPMCE